jgi:hypothetical protein
MHLRKGTYQKFEISCNQGWAQPSRVTIFGEFSPIGRLIGKVFLITEAPKFKGCGKGDICMYVCISFLINWLGYTLGDFLKNSSGHPAAPPSMSMQFWTGLSSALVPHILPVDIRVARWFVFKPKIPNLVNFGGPFNAKCRYIL